MSNRCESCQKFAALETQEPEIDGYEVNEDGVVTVSARLVRSCADCGGEMKETNFDLEGTVEDLCACKKRELDVEEAESPEIIEEGGGRYAKSFYGVKCVATVTCQKCEKKWTVEMSDKTPASAMDDLN